MKKAIFAVVLGIVVMGAGCSAASNPDQSNVSGNGETKTYENSLYSFQFKYPANAQESVLTLGNLDEKLVQFELPVDQYPSTNLAEAQFIVTALPLDELDSCLSLALPDESVKFDTANKIVINGQDFYSATVIDQDSADLYESRIYRAFNDYVCFEFEEAIHTTNVEEGVTEVDKSSVWQSLEEMLQSVTFDRPNV